MAKITKNKTWLIISFLTLIFSGFLFSFRLRKVPPGLTSDEAAFGYNGALLAETGRDQNGKLMPFFVLSLDGKDWRQPVTQYSTALFFRIFGASLFNLRFVSVSVALVSLFLIMSLAKKLWGNFAAVSAAEEGLVPVIDRDLYSSDGVVAHFYEAAYFDEKLIQYSPGVVLPEGSLLMTYRENLEGVKKLEDLPNYKLYVKE